jgi:outer membrane protein with beta-barrel domain
MRKLFFATIMIACAASFSFAQSGDDYNKYDVYVGYSHNRVDFGGDHEGFNGVEAAVTGNISRYVGLKGDYAFHFKSFDAAPFDLDARAHNLVGGVQFKDNSKETKLKPFAHLMAGIQHARVSGLVSDSETGFAGVIGGGLDIRLSPRVDFRVVQLDYNPTRLGGETQHNFRVGIGIVFR